MVDSLESADRTEALANARALRLFIWPLGLVIVLGWLLLVPGLGPNLRLLSVASGSMLPDYRTGQTLVVSRLSYGLSRWSYDGLALPIEGRFPAIAPGRGDVIAFRAPTRTDTIYIKRVIGMPGERIQMKGGRLLINGEAVLRRKIDDPSLDIPSRKAESAAYWETLPRQLPHRILETEGDTGFLDDTAEFTVPPGHVFVMGDNRDNSVDSRQSPAQGGLGAVPIDHVIGRVLFNMSEALRDDDDPDEG